MARRSSATWVAALLVLVCGVLASASLAGERSDRAPWRPWGEWELPPEDQEVIWFPDGDLFAAPLGDQKQPRFHATYQNWNTEFGAVNVGSVGFGENFGIVRRPGEREGDGWQLGVSAAVLAIFNLDAESADLLNADYHFGFPLSWRRNKLAIRARMYHLSAHLGDEFLLNPEPPNPVRINLSYEAIELLASWGEGGWRTYAGGSKIFHTTTPLERNRLQLGAEFRGGARAWRSVRLLAAVDAQAWEETDYDVDLSVKAGIQARSPYGGQREVQFLLEFYTGRVPHGQFYVYRTNYLGFGIAFSR